MSSSSRRLPHSDQGYLGPKDGSSEPHPSDTTAPRATPESEDPRDAKLDDCSRKGCSYVRSEDIPGTAKGCRFGVSMIPFTFIGSERLFMLMHHDGGLTRDSYARGCSKGFERGAVRLIAFGHARSHLFVALPTTTPRKTTYSPPTLPVFRQTKVSPTILLYQIQQPRADSPTGCSFVNVSDHLFRIYAKVIFEGSLHARTFSARPSNFGSSVIYLSSSKSGSSATDSSSSRVLCRWPLYLSLNFCLRPDSECSRSSLLSCLLYLAGFRITLPR